MNTLRIEFDEKDRPRIYFLQNGKPTDVLLNQPFIVESEYSATVRNILLQWEEQLNNELTNWDGDCKE